MARARPSPTPRSPWAPGGSPSSTRCPERAATLAAQLNRHFGDGRADHAAPDRLAGLLTRADGIVHATPTGMAAHPGLPLPAELLHPGLWIAEVVYRPLETELLRTARALGCATLDGGGMAVFQAADAFRLFTGREPDAVRMLADITDLAGALGARSRKEVATCGRPSPPSPSADPSPRSSRPPPWPASTAWRSSRTTCWPAP